MKSLVDSTILDTHSEGKDLQDLEYDNNLTDKSEKHNLLILKNQKYYSSQNQKSGSGSNKIIPLSNNRNYANINVNNSVKSDEEFKYITMLYNKQLLVSNYLKFKFSSIISLV